MAAPQQTQQPQQPITQVFVTNINYNTTEDELRKEFSQFGEIKFVKIITTPFRGVYVSRGFGFVTFTTEDAKNKAIAASQKLQVARRNLIIKEARPKPRLPRDTLFVAGIPQGTTPENVIALFPGCNPVRAKIIRPDTPERRGFGFIQFDSEESEKKAFALYRSTPLALGETKITVRLARRPYDLPRRRFFPSKYGNRRRAQRSNSY